MFSGSPWKSEGKVKKKNFFYFRVWEIASDWTLSLSISQIILPFPPSFRKKREKEEKESLFFLFHSRISSSIFLVFFLFSLPLGGRRFPRQREKKKGKRNRKQKKDTLWGKQQSVVVRHPSSQLVLSCCECACMSTTIIERFSVVLVATIVASSLLLYFRRISSFRNVLLFIQFLLSRFVGTEPEFYFSLVPHPTCPIWNASPPLFAFP